MRISRRRFGWGLALLIAFLLALVALFPLRLALEAFGFGERGLTARAVTGSIWNGALQEARFGPVPLGDVSARLNVLPLFLGRARLSLESEAPDRLQGAVTLSRHSVGVDDVTARLRLGALLLPRTAATLDLDDFSLRFASGRCTQAEGRVQAGVSAQLAGLRFGSSLSGIARCDGEALLLPLSSRSGERVDVRLFADGRYRAEWRIRVAEPVLAAALLALGFRSAQEGFILRVDGAF